MRQTALSDALALEELRAALHGEGIQDMDVPLYDTPGAYVVEDKSGIVGALILRAEHLACVYVKPTHRQRGVGLIALGVVAELYFAQTDVPALGTVALTTGAKALADCVCDPGRRYLTRNHWRAVVRPRVLQKLTSIS